MAANDLNSDDVKKQELDYMTTCCICTEVYTDPKALPCIHTFCMRCIQETGLKNNKGPGDEMPCPICRRMFKIPKEGFCGLPKNFFIEKLMEVANISESSQTLKALCDACLEDENEETGKQISAADAYCVNCKHKLCEECCSEHRKFKLTKNHKLIPMTEHESCQSVMTHLAPSVCEIHEQKVLDVYCVDCQTVVCYICFIDDHNNHKGSHVTKFLDGFRKQIESNAEAINMCRSQAETRKAGLLKVKENIQERVHNLECDLEKGKAELKQFADKHATSLLQSLCLIRQSKLKEIEMETSDIDTYLTSLETYNSYCQKIMAKGSTSDICRAFPDLSVRAVELQQQCQPMIEREIQSFNFCFRKAEPEFLEENCNILIGEIEEEGDLWSKKRSKQVLLAEQSNETDLLRKENKTLEDNVKKLKQELETTKAESIKKISNLEEKLKQEQNEKEQLTIRKTQETRRLLGKFNLDLVLTIRTKAAEEKKKPICGLTILGEELFVVDDASSEVEVYDSIKLSFRRRWNLNELIDPNDIGACNRNKCLYVSDYKGFRKSKEILRVDPNGQLIKNWSTGYDNGCSLSVTEESNVILAVDEKNKLNEYSPNGQLLREIYLSLEAGVRHPKHAIKLTNGHFVVSHGSENDDQHRVSIVDADGKLKKSFGGERGSTIGQMNKPLYLTVDRNGFVMVADQENSRVLLMDSDLKFSRVILSKEQHGLRNPRRILLDESSNRLLMADNEYDSIMGILGNGRILIFDFK